MDSLKRKCANVEATSRKPFDTTHKTRTLEHPPPRAKTMAPSLRTLLSVLVLACAPLRALGCGFDSALYLTAAREHPHGVAPEKKHSMFSKPYWSLNAAALDVRGGACGGAAPRKQKPASKVPKQQRAFVQRRR